MMGARPAGFLGLGYAVPEEVVANDDPRFASTGGARHGHVSEADLFTGLRERRRLADGDTVEDLMARAARTALEAAGLAASEVDRIYGYASPSSHLSPNGLYRVHRALGLRRDALVVPVQTEFTNFVTASALASEAIGAGRCERALVACGGGWTRNMDYENPHAASIGDGAAAGVIGPGERLVIVDHVWETFSEDEETMVLDLAPAEGGMSRARFAMTSDGVRSFVENGVSVPPRLVHALLDRNRIAPERVALITHQASRRLMDAWADAIRPGEYPSTLEEYGNMTLATAGVTLAHHAARIQSDYIVLVALGLGVHFNALLIRR